MKKHLFSPAIVKRWLLDYGPLGSPSGPALFQLSVIGEETPPMSTALRIMTQHDSASSPLHPHPHGSERRLFLPEGGVAKAHFKIWVGFSFLVVC